MGIAFVSLHSTSTPQKDMFYVQIILYIYTLTLRVCVVLIIITKGLSLFFHSLFDINISQFEVKSDPK